jgi:hypothetical protein
LQIPFMPAYADYVQGHAGGPKTSRGKAGSSRNSLKHGLTAAAAPVPEVESIEDWERHAEQVIAGIAPEGYLETQLAVRAAEILWRLRRISQYEADKISLALEQMPEKLAETAHYGAKLTGNPVEEMTLEGVRVQTGIRLRPGPDACSKSPDTKPTSTVSSSRPSTRSKPCRACPEDGAANEGPAAGANTAPWPASTSAASPAHEAAPATLFTLARKAGGPVRLGRRVGPQVRGEGIVQTLARRTGEGLRAAEG